AAGADSWLPGVTEMLLAPWPSAAMVGTARLVWLKEGLHGAKFTTTRDPGRTTGAAIASRPIVLPRACRLTNTLPLLHSLPILPSACLPSMTKLAPETIFGGLHPL